MARHPFKAKSHILSLLGDELIGSDSLAVFELVKNAYDADAEEVTIYLNDLNTASQNIVIEDDGSGMTLATLKDVWLEIGTDFKRGENRKPSNKYQRLSLGEKGVGRLAVHKLGKQITLETQAEGERNSSRISFNWQDIIQQEEYIQDITVDIEEVPESLFKKGHGTRIKIFDLKKKNWTRRDLRDLTRKTYSMKSPFKKIDHFDVTIKANDDHQSWFEDIKTTDDFLGNALYSFEFELSPSKPESKTPFANITWTYKFNPPETFGLAPITKGLKDMSKIDKAANFFKILPKDEDDKLLFDEDQKHLKNEDLKGIGKISGKFYVYNLFGPVLKAYGQSRAIKDFVQDNFGVKVFRDGIRVYNYGERHDDWLGLDLARVQKLGERFSKNTVVGAIEIELKETHDTLKEKTNREGFDENDYYLKFKSISSQVFDFFQRTLAQQDREKMNNYVEGVKPVKKVGLAETITELEEKLKEKKMLDEFSPILKRVQKDYNEMRDVMVNSGMSGLNLSLVFHEVDREIKLINTDLKNDGADLKSIRTRISNLIELLNNFAPILRQNKNIDTTASHLAEQARKINHPRFAFHKVIFSSPLISNESEDFNVNGPANLLVSSISNIIDNSIYWSAAKREVETADYKAAIYIGSDTTSFSGPAIIIADTGAGFSIPPEDLIIPFRTTRPGGMGLGLYFVNMVMEMIGGKLLFPDKEEVNLPTPYTGAIIALVFPKKDS
jgi:signal transduction histidine kinase